MTTIRPMEANFQTSGFERSVCFFYCRSLTSALIGITVMIENKRNNATLISTRKCQQVPNTLTLLQACIEQEISPPLKKSIPATHKLLSLWAVL